MARTVQLFRQDTYAEIRAVDSQSDLRVFFIVMIRNCLFGHRLSVCI